MNPNWLCRDYQPGDETKILELFTIVFKRDLPLSFWLWRYRDNIWGQPIIRLLFDGDKLIGHYAVCASRLIIAGQEVPAVFSMTTMTHPDYGRQGIFPFLAEQVYAEAARQGYKLVYGFPNNNSVHSFTRKLNWFDCGTMTSLVGKTPRSSESHHEIYLHSPTRFNHDWQADLSTMIDESRIHTKRTGDYLQWRYWGSPDSPYFPVIVLRRRSLIGLAVLKLYDDGPTRQTFGHIVEWFCADTPAARSSLLDACFHFFRTKKVGKISSWVSNHELRSMLETAGFMPENSNFHFGCRWFDSMAPIDIGDKANWALVMGDCDVF